jgi:hypothetical protein
VIVALLWLEPQATRFTAEVCDITLEGGVLIYVLEFLVGLQVALKKIGRF